MSRIRMGCLMDMLDTISSLEDGSSANYRGRANFAALVDSSAMADSLWRGRLQAALDNSGKSKRAVSLASGNGPGYMHSILKEGKDPTVENLMSVCDALSVSVVYILHGIDVGPDEAELLSALRNHPEKREAIFALLGSAPAA